MKTTGQQGIFSRVPLSYMGWLTVGSLVGIGIGFWVLLMTIRGREQRQGNRATLVEDIEQVRAGKQC